MFHYKQSEDHLFIIFAPQSIEILERKEWWEDIVNIEKGQALVLEGKGPW
jgi:hypothetical protein